MAVKRKIKAVAKIFRTSCALNYHPLARLLCTYSTDWDVGGSWSLRARSVVYSLPVVLVAAFRNRHIMGWISGHK
jgi:hypothetical protein